MNNFFKQMVNELNLGNLKSNPSRLYGGLTHKMYLVETDKGKYVVKLLNKNIMKRSNALDNFSKAEEYEKLLEKNNIPCIYALEFNGKKMQKIDNQYFYVYNWYDGKTLKNSDITIENCNKIAEVLSKIHNIDIKDGFNTIPEKNIDFDYYIDLLKENNKELYKLLYDNLDIIKESMANGNKSIKDIPMVSSICHNDLDSKNVMWKNNDFRIIDLECLCYSNPYLELYEMALCWSGYEDCNIDFSLFKSFFKSYINNSTLDMNIDWESIYCVNNGRLEWLEFNLKRSLLIECDSREEQELGIKEVKKTIEPIIYYEKMKDKILKTINEVINIVIK